MWLIWIVTNARCIDNDKINKFRGFYSPTCHFYCLYQSVISHMGNFYLLKADFTAHKYIDKSRYSQ